MISIPSPLLKQRLSLLLWLALFLSMIIYLHSSLQVRSDISFFLPENASEIDTAMRHQLKHGEAGKIILIALYGKDPLQLAELNKNLAMELKQNKEFLQVQNGQFSLTELIIEPYYSYRYLIHSQADNFFSQEKLTQSFNQLLQRLQLMPSPLEQKLFAEDPQMIWFNLLQQWHNQQLPKRHGVWFDTQAKQTLLFVKTQANGYDLLQQKKNVEFIKQSIKKSIKSQNINPESVPELDYVLTGAPVFALTSQQAISQQIKTISVLAAFTLLVFLYWFFRSGKIVLLIALPISFAVVTGITSVILIDGFIHGITIAFGITIIGIAVDYPVHFYSHALFINKNSNQVHSVIQSIWPMLRLGLITTLIGFSAITLSDFSGLRQLGLFAISGLFAAAMLTRFLLPLLSATVATTISSTDNKAYLILRDFIKHPLPHFSRPVSIVLPLLALLYIILNQSTLWQKDLAALSPVPQWQKQQDFELRKAMDLPELRYALVLQNPDPEALLQQSEQLKALLDTLKQKEIISGYDMAANYLPSIRQQKNQQQKLPDANTLKMLLKQILKNTPLNTEAFSPFIESLANSRQTLPLTSDMLLNESSFITDKVTTLLFQQSSSTNWIAIIPLQGVQHGLYKIDFAPAQLLDLKTQTENMLVHYRNEALLWFFSGSMLILAVLYSSNKKLSTLLSLIWPFTGAVILTITSLLLLGFSLSIFHLVTLLLVVGLGIDYSIFTFYAQKQSSDVARVSVIICLLSTLIMFGALSLSDLPVLKAIGLTASLGAFYAFLLTRLLARY